MQIWIDADACPVVAKDLIIKTAIRTETLAIFVANQSIKLRKSPWVNMAVVGQGFDVADDYIADNVQAGDLVITADIPLADAVITNGKVLTPHVWNTPKTTLSKSSMPEILWTPCEAQDCLTQVRWADKSRMVIKTKKPLPMG